MNNVVIKKTIAVILFCLGSPSVISAQNSANDSGQNDHVRFGKESVYLHYNASLLLVGEYLYYNAYVLNAENNNPTEISKIAYVVLLNEDGSTIFKHKVRLNKGIGNGDFFIPVAVPSGNYKLVGYTQWMTNWDENHFFASDITIINPYTNDQKALRHSNENDAPNANEAGYSSSDLKVATTTTDSNFQILLEKGTFSKREKVMVQLSGTGEVFHGNYSVSVRKRASVDPPLRVNANNFMTKEPRPAAKLSDGTALILPELRGELLTGSITSKNENVSVSNQKIAFSIPGPEYELKILTTDKNGVFNFSLDKEYLGEQGVFQVLGENASDFSIQMEDRFSIDAKQFDFGKFRLDSEMKDMIVERSIYNQIENAYFKAKPDTLKIAAERLAFYGNPEITYDLDDYTRFKTVKETLVEVIDNVWMTTDKNGKSMLHVRDLYTSDLQTAYKTLVLVDGLLLQDIDPLLNLDSRKIKTIRLLRNKYVFGSFIFQGIVDIETFDNDFYDFRKPSHAKEVELFKPLPQKNYFKQEYGLADSSLENIPDYRMQLLWMPSLRLNSTNSFFDFFTSDVTGDFEISIEGFSKDGRPTSLRKIFTVD
ncbi:hypothetical protein N9954_02680 [Maribacter sp.]|nr:hypothetical protein [Maribacter sp.]